jgi:Cof subfamily protein (haloacid dehalogenase superfamily)
MYKVIFIDLDGTLLNDSKELSEENLKQLNRAYEEKGIKTIITTGRQTGYIQNIYDKYNCHFGDYIISNNGAIVKNIKTNEYINKESIPVEDLHFLREVALETELNYLLIYTEERAYIEKKPFIKTQKEIVVDNIYDFFVNRDEPLFLCTTGGDIENLEKAINKISKYPNLSSTPICDYNVIIDNKTYNHKYIDVGKTESTKQSAILKVLDKFNINSDEMIVIGDGGNDVPMFECGGYKIAMGNADDIIKAKADSITDTNNNDGVAKAIKKIIFNEE